MKSMSKLLEDIAQLVDSETLELIQSEALSCEDPDGFLSEQLAILKKDAVELPSGYQVIPHIVQVWKEDPAEDDLVVKNEQRGWAIRRESPEGVVMLSGRTMDFIIATEITNPFESREQAENSLLSYVATMREFASCERVAVIPRVVRIPYCPNIEKPKQVNREKLNISARVDAAQYETLYRIEAALREVNAKIEGRPVASLSDAIRYLIDAVSVASSR